MANEFSVHRLNTQGLAKAEQLAAAFDECLAKIDLIGFGPAVFSRAQIVTKLQEACFFAKRALALDPRNQEEE